MDISGVNARMLPSLGGCLIVTGVNARATNTRVAHQIEDNTTCFLAENINPDSTAPPSVARCFSAE